MTKKDMVDLCDFLFTQAKQDPLFASPDKDEKSLRWLAQNDPIFSAFLDAEVRGGRLSTGYSGMGEADFLEVLESSDISRYDMFRFIRLVLNKNRSLQDRLAEIAANGATPGVQINVDWNNIPQEIRDSLVASYRESKQP